MFTYNKLVRDHIPQIIEASGKSYEVKILDDSAYEEALKAKLIEELADLYEVLRSLVAAKGLSDEQFMNVVNSKKDKRGSFSEKLFLVQVSK